MHDQQASDQCSSPIHGIFLNHTRHFMHNDTTFMPSDRRYATTREYTGYHARYSANQVSELEHQWRCGAILSTMRWAGRVRARTTCTTASSRGPVCVQTYYIGGSACMIETAKAWSYRLLCNESGTYLRHHASST